MMKSPAISPIDGLVDLACRDGIDVRPTLLRVLTDLYVQKPVHSADEQTQYVELALGLIEAVDDATRAAVAASLAHYPAAPPAVLARLAGVASPSHATSADAKGESVAEPGDLVELFFTADAEERRLILLNFDAASSRPATSSAPSSGEIVKRLENAALQRNAGEFSRTLERALGIGRSLAERIARDPSGEPIVVAAKALGMKAAVLQRILLFINPAVGQSVQRVYDLALLYDELTRAAADGMVAIWQQGGGAPHTPQAAVHEPVHDADARRDARALAAPEPRRAVRELEAHPGRAKANR